MKQAENARTVTGTRQKLYLTTFLCRVLPANLQSDLCSHPFCHRSAPLDVMKHTAAALDLKRLKEGTSVAHLLEDDGCIMLEYTRCGVAMQIAQYKLRRPMRHGVLAAWSYEPIDAMIFGNGKYDQLILAQDYLRLRTASARMCGCPTFCGCRPSTSDYTMLLRDVTVIEMGTELVPWTVVLPLLWGIAIPAFWVMYWHGEANNYTVTFMWFIFLLLALCAVAIVCLLVEDGDGDGGGGGSDTNDGLLDSLGTATTTSSGRQKISPRWGVVFVICVGLTIDAANDSSLEMQAFLGLVWVIALVIIYVDVKYEALEDRVTRTLGLQGYYTHRKAVPGWVAVAAICVYFMHKSPEMSFQQSAMLGTFVLAYVPGVFFFGIYDDNRFLLSLFPPILFVIFMRSVEFNPWRGLAQMLFLYVLGVGMSAMRGWTRRPYVYFGVLVGSGEREGSGHGKGTSPFWVRMARGQSQLMLSEVVESVRNAAKLSLQQDLAFAKKGNGHRESEYTFNPVYDQDDQLPVSAAQVLGDHLQNETVAGLLLISIEGIPWLVALVGNAFFFLSGIFIVFLDSANEHGEGFFGGLALMLGFADTKVRIYLSICTSYTSSPHQAVRSVADGSSFLCPAVWSLRPRCLRLPAGLRLRLTRAAAVLERTGRDGLCGCILQSLVRA